jgi:ribonucleoside-diphosphate reductase alpha chain
LDKPRNIDWENKTYESSTKWDWMKEGDDSLLTTQFDGYKWKFDKGRGLLRETIVEDYAVSYLKSINEWNEDADWASTTSTLNIDDHVNTMAVMSKYIDSAMSKTVNIPNNYSYDEFKDLYKKLYKTGTVKGGTTYRAGTMTSVLSSVTDSASKKQETNTLPKTQSPKRPKTLFCDIHQLQVNGEKWIVIVGLYGDKKDPYEVFAFKKKEINLSGNIKNGYLSKVKSGRYDLDINGIIIEDVKKHFETREEEALTRMISTALRHGADINFIYDQLQKSEGTIVSFSKAIARTLKKYLIDSNFTALDCDSCGSKGTLIMQEGCYVCSSCGWSKCS